MSRSWIRVGEPGIGELQDRGFAFELGRDVEQIAGIEADIERLGAVLDLDLLGRAAGIRIGHRKHQPAAGERQLHRAPALARYRRHPVDRLLELLLVDGEFLVVADRDDAPVVGKRSVDELGGEHRVAEREADLALRELDRDLGLVVFDQALHLAHGLARNDDSRHAAGAFGQRQLELRQAVAVGRDRAQRRRLVGAGGVEIDAVEIVARLLGRDRELGLVDQAFEIGCRELERVRHLARREIGEIALRQRLQGKAGAAGADRQHGPVAGGLEHDLRALGELAHDLIEHVRRHRGRAAWAHLRRDGLRNLEIEVGRLEGELRFVRLDQHIRQNWDGVAALDHAVDMAERLQQRCAFDGDLHLSVRLLAWKRGVGKWRVWPLCARAAAPLAGTYQRIWRPLRPGDRP